MFLLTIVEETLFLWILWKNEHAILSTTQSLGYCSANIFGVYIRLRGRMPLAIVTELLMLMWYWDENAGIEQGRKTKPRGPER